MTPRDLGPAPELVGITASWNGIEFDSERGAVIIDVDEFLANYGEPATHKRAQEIVDDDPDGQFDESWREALEESEEDAKRDAAYDQFVDWCDDNGRKPYV
jgi:hypothetical protein